MPPMTERVEAKTIFGNPNVGPGGVGVNTKLGTISYFSLMNVNGIEIFLWFNSTGQLCRGTAVPTDPDADGTVIG